jgi:tRNA(Ile)-lysidine synthase
VAHLNHRLRRTESDEDCAFVRRTAEKMGLPFFGSGEDVNARARTNRVSTEMAAREARLEFLGKVARDFGAKKIALGHHRDDQVELFWLRILRGSAGEGLAGMDWKSPFPIARESGSIELIRPFLNLGKADLVQFARENGLKYRKDSTNLQYDFARNRLRLELLPRLEKDHPALRETTLRIMEVLGAEKEWLGLQAHEWLQTRGAEFGGLHLALQREIIFRQLLALGCEPSFELIERLRKHPGQPFTVAPSQRVQLADSGLLTFEEEAAKVVFNGDAVQLPVTEQGTSRFGGLEIKWALIESRKSEAGIEYFDADQVGGSMRLRHWHPGDRFQPIGLKSSAKLQDLFTNQKISRNERHEKIVAESASGEIFWVENLRIGERFKVAAATRRVLEWKATRSAQPGRAL